MASKKIDYASLYTKRKDGRYQGDYYDRAGKRHSVCDKDPAKLFRRLSELSAAAKQPEPEPTFAAIADAWERKHREEIEVRTWNNYRPHLRELLDEHGARPFGEIEPADIVADLARAKARGWSGRGSDR